MPATPNRALPFPALADIPDVPADMAALAVALDQDLFLLEDDVRPAFGVRGRVFRDTDDGLLDLDIGTAWVRLTTGGPYVPVAGGAMTGDLDLGDHELINARVRNRRSKITTIAVAGAARTIDFQESVLWDLLLDQDLTLTWDALNGEEAVLVLRQGAIARQVIWPATTRFHLDRPPAQRPNSITVYRLTALGAQVLVTGGQGVGDLIPHTEVVVVDAPAPPDYSQSGAYVNLPNRVRFLEFPKYRTDTKLVIEARGGTRSTDEFGSYVVGAKVGGALAADVYFGTGLVGNAGTIQLAGHAAGPYDIELQWHRINGIGDMAQDGRTSLKITETY